MSIKRSTADWQRLVLQKLWRVETITQLLDNEEEDGSQRTRDMDGVLRTYPGKDAVDDELENCKPMSALVDKNGCTWIAYHPTVDQFRNDTTRRSKNDNEWSHSVVQLMKVKHNDDSGEMLCNACWFAPVEFCEDEIHTLDNVTQLKEFADQYVLLLPRMDDNGEYTNMFYGVGNKWTERVRNGTWVEPQLCRELFLEWLLDNNNNNNNNTAETASSQLSRDNNDSGSEEDDSCESDGSE